MITNAGLDYALAAAITGGSQISTWYLGLIDLASFTTGLAQTDTMSSHPGWIENTQYAETTRPQLVSTEAGQAISQALATVFTPNAGPTITGYFITSNNTKGGTTGTLFSTVPFPINQVAQSGTPIQIKYPLSAVGG